MAWDSWVKFAGGIVVEAQTGKAAIRGCVRTDQVEAFRQLVHGSEAFMRALEGLISDGDNQVRVTSWRSLGLGTFMFEGVRLRTDGATGLSGAQATALDWVNDIDRRFGLLEVEHQHALDNVGLEYGEECVRQLVGGREVRVPSYPAECDYVRVCLAGLELAYWSADEFKDDAACVLGALTGAMATPS